MAKYSKDLAEKICELIEDGETTISELCNIFQITRNCFYLWKAEKKEFREALQKAVERRNEKLFCLGREMIRRRLKGYKTVTVKTTYVPSKVHGEKMVVEKQVVTEREHAMDASTLNVILKKSYEETEKELRELPQRQPMIVEVIDEETKREFEKLQRGERDELTPEAIEKARRVKEEYARLCTAPPRFPDRRV